MIEVRAADLRAGDEIAGWQGYIVTRYQRHPTGATGRIMLRDTRPTTAPHCWTPCDPDTLVTVLARKETDAD